MAIMDPLTPWDAAGLQRDPRKLKNAFEAAVDGDTRELDAYRKYGKEIAEGPSPKTPDVAEGKGLTDIKMGDKEGFSWGELIKGAVPAAIAGIGALAGSETLMGIGGTAGGIVGEDWMRQARDRQMEELQRRQTAWNDAYEMAKSLPPEIYGDPRFGELTTAAQALQKDLADGKVDNEKNLSAFLAAQAKYRRELTAFEDETRRGREAEDAAAAQEAGVEREQQMYARVEEILRDPTASPEQKAWAQDQMTNRAQAITAEDGTVQYLNPEQQLRLQQLKVQEASQAEQIRHNQAMEGEARASREQSWRQFTEAQNRSDRFGMLGSIAGLGEDVDTLAGRMAQPYFREGMGPQDAQAMLSQAQAQAWGDAGPQFLEMATSAGLVKPGPGGTIQVAGMAEPIPYPPPERVVRVGEIAAEISERVMTQFQGEFPGRSATLEQLTEIPKYQGIAVRAIQARDAFQQLQQQQIDAYNTVRRAASTAAMQLRGR